MNVFCSRERKLKLIMECKGLWSDCAPTDILTSVLSRLVASDHYVFRAVCKRWCSIESPPMTLTSSPSLIRSSYPGEKGYLDLFNPLNGTHKKMDLPDQLKGSRIRCAKESWLLMSQGDYAIFLFNPISNSIIKLADLDERNGIPCWTFSCPPDSSTSDCIVVGFLSYPNRAYMIRVGETRWTLSDNVFGSLSQLNNPVFLEDNTSVCILGRNGGLGILRIQDEEVPTWEIYRKPNLSRKRKSSIWQSFVAEDIDNGGILVVFLTHEDGKVDVWRYNTNMNGLEREKITSLDNKTLFVSSGGSYLKPCIAPGLQNKIFFPMLHNNNCVFYCLATRKYYSLDYSFNGAFSSSNYYNLVRPRSCVWIESI